MEFKSGYNFIKKVQYLEENTIVQLHEKGTKKLYNIKNGTIEIKNSSTCETIETKAFNNNDVKQLENFLKNLGVKNRNNLSYRVLNY